MPTSVHDGTTSTTGKWRRATARAVASIVIVAISVGPAHAELPREASLEGFVRPFGVSFPIYRIFLIAVGIAICIAFWALLYRTRWGTRLVKTLLRRIA